MVRLAHLDLAQPVYPSFLNQTQAIDVIFCRNVLMYFTPTMMQAIVDRFFEALVPGGWLIVSPSEATHPLFSAFTSCQLAGVVLHQKPKLTGIQAWAGVSDEQNFEGVLTPQPSPSPDVGIRLSPPAGSRPELVEERLGELSEPMEDLTLARAADNRGQLAEAQVWCEQALAANKLNPNAHYLLAVIFEAQGQPAKARQALNRALYLDPDFALAHLALGHLVQRQEGPTQASKHFKNALTLLKRLPPATPLPEAEGLTSGRLIELIEGLL
jgi:chemotaxis protein methyltransferase CheR